MRTLTHRILLIAFYYLLHGKAENLGRRRQLEFIRPFRVVQESDYEDSLGLAPNQRRANANDYRNGKGSISKKGSKKGKKGKGKGKGGNIFNMESPAASPVYYPSSTSTRLPTNVPQHPPCSVCGEGYVIENEKGNIYFMGKLVPCLSFQMAGLIGQLPPASCDLVPPIVEDACGCREIKESDQCEVCGPGYSVENEGNKIQIEELPEVTCGELVEVGLSGLIDESVCEDIIVDVLHQCGCVLDSPIAPSSRPVPEPPIRTPSVSVPTPYPTLPLVFCPEIPMGGCAICGEGRCIYNHNAVFSYPGQPAVPCDVLEHAGIEGIITDDQCEALPDLIEEVCGCVESPEAPSPPSIPVTPLPPTASPSAGSPEPTSEPFAPSVPPGPTVSTPIPNVTPEPTEPSDATSFPSESTPATPSPTTASFLCPEIPEGGCSICGDKRCVTNYDSVFSVPGQPAVPCGILEQAGLQGVVADDQCEFLPNLINETCGCATAPSAPSIPSPPLESPVPQNDSVIDFFFCEVCGEGRVIGATPGATVSIPGEEDEICYEVAEDGATGRIDRERCEKIKPYVEQSCGCQAKNPPCLVCGVGQTIIDANGVISFPGMPPFSCRQVAQAGFHGVIPATQCVPTIPIVIEYCGCQDIPTEPQPCLVCGEGYDIIYPNATATLPGHPPLLCSDLVRGIGLIDPALCADLLPFVVNNCGCKASSMYPECNVCGEGLLVGNVDALVTVGDREVACGKLEREGRQGLIEPDTCEILSSNSSGVAETCGCSPEECEPFPRCDVCGEGKVIVQQDAIVSLPGQDDFTCSELASLGRQCRLDPAFCPTVMPEVEAACGCRDLLLLGAPTVSPAPSVRPIELPTGIIGPNSCFADDNGNFGVIGSGTGTPVTFFYEVEVEAETTGSDIESDMIAQFEAIISNAIISMLFADFCGGSTSRRLQQEVLGVSSSPRDKVIKDSCIEELSQATDECFVVAGKATLFIPEGADGLSPTAIALSSIRDSMNKVGLYYFDDRIIKVSYRNTVPDSINQSEVRSEDPGTPSWVWVLVAVGSVGLIAGIVFVWSRRRRRQEQAIQAFNSGGVKALGAFPDTSDIYMHARDSPWDVIDRSMPPGGSTSSGVSAREGLGKKSTGLEESEMEGLNPKASLLPFSAFGEDDEDQHLYDTALDAGRKVI